MESEINEQQHDERSENYHENGAYDVVVRGSLRLGKASHMLGVLVFENISVVSAITSR